MADVMRWEGNLVMTGLREMTEEWNTTVGYRDSHFNLHLLWTITETSVKRIMMLLLTLISVVNWDMVHVLQ